MFLCGKWGAPISIYHTLVGGPDEIAPAPLVHRLVRHYLTGNVEQPGSGGKIWAFLCFSPTIVDLVLFVVKGLLKEVFEGVHLNATLIALVGTRAINIGTNI